VELPLHEEVGDAPRGEVTRPILVGADRVLVPEQPKRLLGVHR
jgi:hypothetical protein